MTPDERQLISGLFDRMRDNRPADKDRDAERFINDAMRQTPDAAYLLVQSVLAQEHYLQQAGSRIEELEGRMRDLEDELARLQQSQSRSSGGSFLGGLFGGSRQAEPPPASRSSGSVPSFGADRGAAPSPSYGQAGSPWGRQQPQPQGGYAAPAAGGAFGQQPTAQQPARGGGFMASALTTAAGVAGGMLAANAISNMLGGGSGAHAAGHPSSTQAASEPSPYEVNSDSDRQREIDYQQDAAQDAELEEEQTASYDDNSDWGSADDSDI